MRRLALAVVAAGPFLRRAEADDPKLYGCVVTFEEDINVPAPEAGVLVKLSVKEGSQVKQGEVIGKIYDDEVQTQKKAAEYALGKAQKAASDDIQYRYAQKSADVAEKAYEAIIKTNQTAEKAIPEVEVLKAKLEWEAAILSAEKALHDQALAKFEYGQRWAELETAKLAIKSRRHFGEYLS